MESTLSPPTAALLALSKTLKYQPSSSLILNPSVTRLYRQFSATSPFLTQCLIRSRGVSTRPLSSSFFKTDAFASIRYLCAAVPPVRYRLACISSPAASFASSGGAGGGNDDFSGRGGGGEGGGRPDGGDPKAVGISGAGDSVSALSPDVIILDVGGMTCGGCAASVKRILESQPDVSSASVNLTTETAVVWPLSEAKVIPNWQKQLGEMLAKHLTNCGFKSNLRGQGAKEEDIS